MKRKFLIFICLILFIVSVAGVSATEDINQTIDDDTLSVSENIDDLTTKDDGTFTDLQKKIDDAREGSTIILENNYTYNSEFSTEGISINKNLTIEGNGYVIDALGQSRIFYIASQKVTLNNITFKNAYADHGGAIIFVNNLSYSSVSCEFINNTASIGGAIYFSGNISNSDVSGEFIGNTALSYDLAGGAIYFGGKLSGCNVSGEFINNTGHHDNGGALHFRSEVSNSSVSGEFIGNYVENTGGAIYFHRKVSGCNVSGEFINNTAGYSGIVYFRGELSGCNISGEFIGNVALCDYAGGGGGIAFSSNVLGCNISGEFINNTGVSGGAILFYGSISDSSLSGEFIGNSIIGKFGGGGAIYLNDVSRCNISGEFINNTAKGGGAIISWGKVSDSNISGEFINNTASGSGGGALLFLKIVCDSSICGRFIGNTASTSGGAINFYPELSNSYFSSCNVSGEFINNTASDGGGAIYFRGKASGFNVSGEYIANTASYAGAIYTGYNVDLMKMNRCNFIENKASQYGTAIYGESDCNIANSNFINNSAFIINNIYCKGFLEITNSTFIPFGDGNKVYYNISGRILNNEGFIEKSDYKVENCILIINNTYLDVLAPDITKYYNGSERFVVTVKEDKPIVGKKVIINLNGVSYTRTTDANGQASMAINLNSGVYPVTVEFEGIEIQSEITVKSTISGNNITKIFRNNTQYCATFVDSNGKLLKNTDVNFNVNGVFYTRTTNDLGVAGMDIDWNPGTYIITAENPNSGEKHTNLITVLPSIVEVHNLTKYYRNDSKLTFRLLDDEGRPVGEGVAAKININGVFYERKSNASGYVNMNINLNPGTYIATLEYNGLMASSTVNVLPVLEAKDVNVSYNNETSFEAKLLDGEGRPFSGQNLTFNINGVFYNRQTDEEGIARLNINLMAGEYIITSMYEPNGAALSNKVTIRG